MQVFAWSTKRVLPVRLNRAGGRARVSRARTSGRGIRWSSMRARQLGVPWKSRTRADVPPMPRDHSSSSRPKSESARRRRKSWPARKPSCAKPAVPRHEHPCARPPGVFQCKAGVSSGATAALGVAGGVPTRRAAPPAYFLRTRYCSAPPAFYWFMQSLSSPPSFQCCTWHSGRWRVLGEDLLTTRSSPRSRRSSARRTVTWIVADAGASARGTRRRVILAGGQEEA